MTEEKIKVHPDKLAFFLRNYGLAAIIAVLLLPAGFFVLSQTQVLEYALAIWSISVIIFAVGLIHTHMHQRIYLALTNEELVHEFGIFNHHHVTVPLNRITDSLIYASFFDRILGVATLKVNTAGGKEFEVIATDFPKEGIKLIHTELNRLLRKMPDSLPDELAKK